MTDWRCGLILVTFSLAGCRRPPVTPSPRPPRSLSPAERAVLVAAVTRLIPPAKDSVPVCIALSDSVRRYEVDAAIRQVLGTRGRGIHDCPPTYASMIYNPQVKGPPGDHDPYRLELHWPVMTANAAIVVAQLWRGTSFSAFRCNVARSLAGWEAQCALTARGFS